ncbi:hypothetical protein V5O48_006614 [Marasmius crinis-equi]|uniref:F-box domain-containing protein n=1 Tax=Marasmius crinis-equi TaxID=585013 RepID=A0ABR3FJ19_9AGAR
MDPLLLAASNATSMDQIDEYIERYRRAIITLSNRRNTLSVTQRIPVDVLVYIFSWYKDIIVQECQLSIKSVPAPDSLEERLILYNGRYDLPTSAYPSEMPSRRPVPWIAPSQVCSHWREVALNCGSFWSTIFLNSVPWTKELLRRSKNSLLEVLPDPRLLNEAGGEVVLRERSRRSNVLATAHETFLIVLKSASSRISSLSIYTAALPQPFRVGEPLILKPFTALKSLRITQRKDWNHSQAGVSTGGEANTWDIALLQNLLSDAEVRLTRLDMNLHRSWLGTRSAHVTHLRISSLYGVHVQQRTPLLTEANIVTILRGFPSLQELVLQNVMNDNNGTTSNSDTTAIKLPHLNHIELVDCPLRAVAFVMQSLQVNSLARVRIRCVSRKRQTHGLGAGNTVTHDTSGGGNGRREINSLFSSLRRLFGTAESGDQSKGKSRADSSWLRSALVSLDRYGTVGLALSRNEDIHIIPGTDVDPDMFACAPDAPRRNYAKTSPSLLPKGNIWNQASVQITLIGIGHIEHDIPGFLLEKELVRDVESAVLYEDESSSVDVKSLYKPWLEMLSSLPHLRRLALYLGRKEAQEVLLESLDARSSPPADGTAGGHDVNFRGLKNLKICFPRLPQTQFCPPAKKRTSRLRGMNDPRLGRRRSPTPNHPAYAHGAFVLHPPSHNNPAAQGQPNAVGVPQYHYNPMNIHTAGAAGLAERIYGYSDDPWYDWGALPMRAPSPSRSNSTSSRRSLPDVLRARRDREHGVQSVTFVAVREATYNRTMEKWAEKCREFVDDVSFERNEASET